MKMRIFICMVATIAIAACTPKEKTVDFPTSRLPRIHHSGLM